MPIVNSGLPATPQSVDGRHRFVGLPHLESFGIDSYLHCLA
ncbi:hypothetical protein [Nitrospira sp. BLG_1]